MRVHEFTPACSCGNPVRFSKFLLTPTKSIILVGFCKYCKDEKGKPVEVHCEFTSEWIDTNYPIDPQFTDKDVVELHQLGICLPESA